MSTGEELLIDTIGWVYTIAWSISFYGQIYENYKSKKYIHRPP